MSSTGTWFLDWERKTISLFKNNFANLIDSYVQYGQSTEKTFYQVQNTKEQIDLEDVDRQIASVYFRVDPQYDIYERRIFSFGELLGQLMFIKFNSKNLEINYLLLQ